MKNIQYTTSGGVPHRSMADEFLCHKNGSEWWYCTGFVNDESGKLFSFQFTLARVWIYGMQMHILMTALTDFEKWECFSVPIRGVRGTEVTQLLLQQASDLAKAGRFASGRESFYT